MRLLKIVKERNKLVKYLQEVLKIGVGFERLLFFFLIFITLCHIVACLWIFSARLNNFSPDTWVVRYGFQDIDDIDVSILRALTSFAFVCSSMWQRSTLP